MNEDEREDLEMSMIALREAEIELDRKIFEFAEICIEDEEVLTR